MREKIGGPLLLAIFLAMFFAIAATVVFELYENDDVCSCDMVKNHECQP